MHEIADKLRQAWFLLRSSQSMIPQTVRQADLNWEKDFKENGLAADFCPSGLTSWKAAVASGA